MSKGGKRPGAGRKKGVLSQKTSQRQQLTEKALAQGKTPLEVMLENMNWAQRRAEENQLAAVNTKDDPETSASDLLELVSGYRKMASDFAKDVAPYIHPKLSTVEHKGSVDSEVTHKLDDKETARRLAFLLAKGVKEKD